MKKLEGLSPDLKLVLKTPLEAIGVRSVTTIKDLRMIDKICKVIEDSQDGFVDLEDADFAYLKERFVNFDNWNPSKISRDIVLQVADILGAVE